jgi:hypothetical protein
MLSEKSKKIKKKVFYVLLAILSVTFFTRDDYRQVTDITSEALRGPIQTPLEGKDSIRFTKDNYEYEIDPLFNYELNGLVVHHMDYTWFSLYKMDSMFPLDLCVLWGDNIKSGTYKSKSLQFTQDARFCRYNLRRDVDFDESEVSNNHILVNNKDLENKLREINSGDQIRLTGKLVNVIGKKMGKVGKYDPDKFSMNTSITRNDREAGACEIIYIEDVEILKKGNPISNLLFRISLWGVLIFLIAGTFGFFWEIFSYRISDRGKDY